ncbi:endonuclease III [bacterium]|nr:endonuclease III [bacterium]
MKNSSRWNKKSLAKLFSAIKVWNDALTYSPIIDLMAAGGDTPWQILVSTMLSARTKDEVTASASRRLFAHAITPEETIKLSIEQLEKAIFPVGFYHTKAKNLAKLSRMMVGDYHSEVPDSVEELIKLPGIGVKTASLVVIKAFNKLDICVDTHVHRISNMWGFVETKKPEETRDALKQALPEEHWKDINQYLVTLGQLVCRPMKHECDKCPVQTLCDHAFKPVKR